MAKRTKKPDLIEALTKIKGCLPFLPKEDERHMMAQIIPEIIQELKVLQESIDHFPDESETHQVSDAINTLLSFFDTLKEKPLLAEMLLPKKTKPGKTPGIAVDINALQNRLETLPTEKILEELTKHKKDVLLELSAKMNITTNKKLTKHVLADRIVKLGFANKRGYNLLGNQQS